MQRKLVEQLKKWGMENVTPVTVTIGKNTYVAARYDSPNHDDRTFIYVIGDHPHTRTGNGKLYTRGNVCYNLPDDTRDWYVAGFFHPEITKTYFKREIKPDPKYQPFGNNFLLTPWTLEDAIDKYEKWTYHRKPMTITEGYSDEPDTNTSTTGPKHST